MQQPRPGARHDESVLFSLQALRRAEESAASPPVTDGSGLIDIRTLAASMAATSGSRSSGDSVAHLGTGSLFAPTPTLEAAPPSETWAARPAGPARGRSLLAACACVALAITLSAASRLRVAEHASPPAPVAAATSAATSSAVPTASVPEAPPTSAAHTSPEPAPSAVAIAPTASPPRKPTAPVSTPLKAFDAPATTRALGAVDLRTCTLTGGPPFEGHARVTLDPSGAVSKAVVDSPELAGTAAERCVVAAYKRVRVPAFSGPALTVGKRFVVMGG